MWSKTREPEQKRRKALTSKFKFNSLATTHPKMNPTPQSMSTNLTTLIANNVINLRLFLCCLAISISGVLFAGCAKTPIPTDPVNRCPLSGSTVNGWFKNGAVSLNGVVNPPDFDTFPDTPNCSFYQWSEHMFLWLTSPTPPEYGGGGGRIFNSSVFYDVSPLDANNNRTLIPHTTTSPFLGNLALRAAKRNNENLNTIAAKSGATLQVELPQLGPSGKPVVSDQEGRPIEVQRVTINSENKAVFFDLKGNVIVNAKPIIAKRLDPRQTVERFTTDNQGPLFLDSLGNNVAVEQGQADGSVLMAQNGSLVYYKSTVNDVYAYFLTGVKDGAILPGTQFPATTAELTQIQAFASAHGKPSPNPFPDPKALTVEIKTAWVEAAGLPNIGDYITMNATIPTYNQSNPNVWIPNGTKTVLMAMASMHVVAPLSGDPQQGTANGHREMIWATFENVHNAPNATYLYAKTPNGIGTMNPDFSQAYVFCSANPNTSQLNKAHMQEDPSGNGNIVSVGGFMISASNIIRAAPWGAAQNAAPNPIPSNATVPILSNTDLISINNNIRLVLNSADVRRNYILTGATWTAGGVAPTTNYGRPGNFPVTLGMAVGTDYEANCALETYLQQPLDPTTHAINFDTTDPTLSKNNCFFCHRTNTTHVSHIFFTPGSFPAPTPGLLPLF